MIVMMKNYDMMKFASSVLCFLNVLLHSSNSYAQTGKQITFTNPDNFERRDELIVLKRSDLENRLGAISNFVELTFNGKEQLLQFDDLNDDGKWDEVVLLISFQPKEKISLTIAPVNIPIKSHAVQRAHVRLRKKNGDDSWGPNITKEEMPLKNPATDFSKQPLPLYLTEGPAWENDKVGFRLYFDVRNGKDIWGKRTSRMVLDSVGTKVEPTYHELHDWGMDVLHAGKSLGAGALALLVPIDNYKDTLIRLGGENIRRTVYQQLADGPIRAVFQITYDWEINGKPVQVKEQTAIWGGQYFYESKVWVSGAPKGTKLVSGIASFYDNVFQAYQTNGTGVLFSHGAQSENKDNLGMAILVPAKDFSFAGSAPNVGSDILNTYLAAEEINEKQPSVFRFVAAWEKSDNSFSKLKTFKNYVTTEAKKMDSPITVQQ
jgi:Domain of unknown function (DUF4861)